MGVPPYHHVASCNVISITFFTVICFVPGANAQDCVSSTEQDLFLPLVVYFFASVAAVLAGGAYIFSKRYQWCNTREASFQIPNAQAAMGRLESSVIIAEPEVEEFTERVPESWQISLRELKFGSRIGVGNVGEVYRGTFRGREVAIKKLLGTWYQNDDMVERFREEILLMSTMNHQNVLMFVGAVFDRDAGNICLVTEICKRGTLYDVLHSEEPLSWPRRLKMARDIALGMDYLHNKAGIIQRDLKSQNLLVTREFDVKIADFGLSRQLAPGKMQTYCGTPATMAPEIARQEEYNEKADVFSFGIILWELLTREEPYPGCSGLALAFAVATRGLRPPIPAYCPAEWAALMVRCWSDSQTQRPSFDEIQRYLAIVIRDFDVQLQAGRKERGFGDTRLRGDSSVSEAVQNTLAAGIAGRNAPWLQARDIIVVGRGAVDPALSPTSVKSTANGDAVPTAFSILRDERRLAAAPVTSSGVSAACSPSNSSPAETLSRGSGILAAGVKSLASARGSLKMVLTAMGLQAPGNDEAPKPGESGAAPTDVVLTVT